MDSERRRQIEQVYESVVERSPAERATLLAQTDPDIRAGVEALLDQPATGLLSEFNWIQLSPGARLGHYQMEAMLGRGGMGEVYAARDTRLGRLVALKILPSSAAQDPDRKRRFIQEARAASALNHPNIVTLYDIAHHSGVDYLVMEHVSGKSLDKLITSQGLPLAEVIGYATQVASALAAAHAAGIVHRDIKPPNVMVTPESQVKVLDFGVAKLLETASNTENMTVTRKPPLTTQGALIGTAAYMSPEQAGGKPVDQRSDIFSLGVMLYEMLAGQRPFQGKSQVETMNSIINDLQPPLARQPPELDEILAKALAKDPQNRYQHAGDLGLDLRRFQDAWQTKSLLSMRTKAIEKPKRAGWVIAICALVTIVGAAAWVAGHSVVPPENPLANAKFTRFTDFEGAEHGAAISPDGKFVAFRSDREGPFDVWLSQVGTGNFANLTKGLEDEQTVDIRTVGFSGDGSEIWLSGGPGRRLRLIPLVGGIPRVFLPEGVVNVAWSPDGTSIVYHTLSDGDPMFVADRNGANPRQIFHREPGGHNHFQTWSPDGRWIYFVSGIQATAELDVWRIQPSGGEPERLTRHNTEVAYVAPVNDRFLLYTARDQDGSGPWLWSLDVSHKRTHRVSFGLEKYTSVAASADGRRVVATVANPSASLWSVPILDKPAGERDVKPYLLPTVRALGPRFGGTALFYLSSLGTGDGLWRYQDGQTFEVWRATDGALLEPSAVSRDGRRVAVVLRKNGKRRLTVVSADGAEIQAVAEGIDVRGTVDWARDGKSIITGGNDASGPGLFQIPLAGGAPVRLIAGVAQNPVWSPDGSLIVYSGPTVSVTGALLAIRPDGRRVELPDIKLRFDGERVRFLPDGKGFVYMQGLLPSQDFWLLDLATKKSRQLTRLENRAAMRTFDITPDGKTIVFDRQRENSDIVLMDLPK